MITYEFLRGGRLGVIKFSGNIDKEKLVSFLTYLFHRKETAGVTKALFGLQRCQSEVWHQ